MHARTARALACLLVVLAPALAGCAVREPDDSLETRVERAPAFVVGHKWTYVIHNAAGERIGNASYTIVAEEEISGRATLRIAETLVHPTLKEPRHREFHWDAETLNLVSPACDIACPTRGRDLDFPLQHNKTWTDGLRDRHAVARYREDAEPGPTGFTRLWEIESRPRACDGGCGATRTVRLYAPDVGLVAERTDYNASGDVEEQWRLEEFDLRAGA